MNLLRPDGAAQGLILIAFLLFMGVCLLLCVLVGPDSDDVEDFYTGKRRLSALLNALALSGDYISAATLLSTTGIVALAGYDGMVLALGTPLALGVLLLTARPLRRTARYTLGDLFALRGTGTGVRIAAAVVALAVSLPFLVVQLAGLGASVAQLVGETSLEAQQFCTAAIGLLMISYVALGGMPATSIVQILKLLLTFSTVAVVAATVLHRFHWSFGALLAAGAAGSGHPDGYLRPGLEFGTTLTGRLDFAGLVLSVVLGAACMPHLLTRVQAAKDGTSARRATRHAIAIVTVFCLMIIVVGIGAAGLVGGRLISAVNPNGQGALVLLTAVLGAGGTTGAGGDALLTAVACSLFLTVLAVVSSITTSAAAAISHDVHAHAKRRRPERPGSEAAVLRWSIVAIGLIGIALAVLTQGANLQFLSALALSLSASTVLPTMLFSLFWPPYNRKGLLWTVYGGLAISVGLQASSPTVSGAPGSLFPDLSFDWFPLQTPTLISVPCAFLLGGAASLLTRRRATAVADQAPGFHAVQERVLLGIGTEHCGP